jgi:hypothetical protein
MFLLFLHGTPHFSFIFTINQKRTFVQQDFFLTRVYTTPPLLNFPLKDEPIEIKIILFGG